MKTFIASLFLAFTAFSASASDTKEMEGALRASITKMTSTMGDYAAMTQASTEFDLIAEANPDQWIAQYYASWAKVILSYNEPDLAKKDLLLDQADIYMEAITAMNVESEERYILAALIANGRMAVDGENRWKQYGKIFDDNLAKAKAINPNNVHYFYLKGVATYFMPKFIGGGAKKALPYLDKAKSLYPSYDKNNVMIPYWGEEMTDYFIGECKKDTEK